MGNNSYVSSLTVPAAATSTNVAADQASPGKAPIPSEEPLPSAAPTDRAGSFGGSGDATSQIGAPAESDKASDNHSEVFSTPPASPVTTAARLIATTTAGGESQATDTSASVVADAARFVCAHDSCAMSFGGAFAMFSVRIPLMIPPLLKADTHLYRSALGVRPWRTAFQYLRGVLPVFHFVHRFSQARS